MQIGELFVSLGIKGSEKTLGAISGVQKGMKDTASVSLEAKAAIVGAMYALERMFAQSGKAGTDLTNINAMLGVSTKTLQQYQYAARQVGISNDEVTGTFKTLSDVATKQLMNGEAPKGLARVSQMIGRNLQQEMFAATKGHPEMLLQALQQYAQAEKNIGLGNSVLKSFGVGDNVIAGMRRNAFRPDVMAKAPTYSDKEVQSLDKANIAWSNLGTTIEMAFGHFNARHGEELVANITKIVKEVAKLAEKFETLAQKAHAFEALNTVFKGWGLIFDEISEAIDALNEFGKAQDDAKKKGAPDAGKVIDNYEKGRDQASYKDRVGDALLSGGQNGDSLIRILSDIVSEALATAPKGEKGRPAPAGATPPPKPGTEVPSAYRLGAPEKKRIGEPAPAAVPVKLVTPTTPSLERAIAPPASAATPGVSVGNSPQNIEVNQTLNFQGNGADPKQAEAAHKKAVRDAYRQMPSQAQGS